MKIKKRSEREREKEEKGNGVSVREERRGGDKASWLCFLLFLI